MYAIDAGDDASPVILHVPHSSRTIPSDLLPTYHLTPEGLEAELDAMTDAYTADLALAAQAAAQPTPWVVRNTLSRLVMDPERFPDDREEMEQAGMGVFYTHTSTGAPLRHPITGAQRDEALMSLYWPYATALADLVDDRLAATGQAIILDIHSYPRQALPYELHQEQPRPPICLGSDPFHTPTWLQAAAHAAFGVDTEQPGPFTGTYVPLRHYQTCATVTSLMIETRRDTYLTASGGLDRDGTARWVNCLSQLLHAISRSPARV